MRAADAVSRMTLTEKICNLDTGGCPIKALGLPGYNWWSEASSGVASGRNTQTTKFAFPITTGMSFNRSLWQITGNTIGREARAMMNAGNGLSTFWCASRCKCWCALRASRRCGCSDWLALWLSAGRQ
eukprot:COSAG01_NODE_5842_length_4001_cov_13.893388_6_plen_128_part_00